MTAEHDTTLEQGLDWLRHIHPVTGHFAAEVETLDLGGRRLSCWMHLLPDTILTLLPFAEAGATVRVGACNPDSTDGRVVRYLEAHGVEVFDSGKSTPAAYAATLERFADTEVICDMGGELIQAAAQARLPVRGALEATMTGIHRIRGLPLEFPVFNWNNIRIKDMLHNRYHVGEGTWPMFGALTGLSLFGRIVLIIGFGPVGHGLAERARALGAIVSVAELDPVRQLEARHAGCRVVSLNQGLAEASIVATATGRDGILSHTNLANMRDGAVLFNSGHSNREIDVPWLDARPHRPMKQHVERYELGDRAIFLLNCGSMINLADIGGFGASESFDPFSAIMVRGLRWLLTEDISAYSPGITDYPPALEREVAATAAAAAS